MRSKDERLYAPPVYPINDFRQWQKNLCDDVLTDVSSLSL
jgi:hypothetical protein